MSYTMSDVTFPPGLLYSIAAALCLVVVNQTVVTTRNFLRRRHYDVIRRKRQEEVKRAIDELEKRVGSVDGESIVHLSLLEIRQRIQDGDLTATEVLKAFQKKAIQVHRLTNCLVEPIREAEQDAAAIDAGKTHGLLAGIPITIKENIAIKNYCSSNGCTKHLHTIAKDDCAVIKILRDHGAVIFARTGQPQLALSYESGNPIYGAVGNPHNPAYNPGGSSSGEGAVVGGGGSILGIGSDIGGSLRLPAHFSGCCAFKPTSQRVSHKGMSTVLSITESCIPSTYGPVSRDVDSLVLAMKVLWDGSMHEIDPLSPTMTFNIESYEDSKPMKIGYFSDNGTFAPTPVCRRAMDMAVQELRKQGHTLVEWLPPEADTCHEYIYQVVFADFGEEILNSLKFDEVDSSLVQTVSWLRDPYWIRWLRAKLYTVLGRGGSDLQRALVGYDKVSRYRDLEADIRKYQLRVTEAWKSEGLDALVSLPCQHPALPLENALLTSHGVKCVTMFNVLNFPSGVVHMTKQTKQDIEALDSCFEIRYPYQRQVRDLISNAEGLPVGVMVSTLRWEDEKCLRLMKAVEKAADFVIT